MPHKCTIKNSTHYLYYWRPSHAEQFHVFASDTMTSLCGKWQDLSSTPEYDRTRVTPDDVFLPELDCQKCFFEAMRRIKNDSTE
jgi:hypothetical protein